ncbi:RNA helicase [Corynebacterium sp. HS2168-gen11]|uniref:DEAD/DEAH box helicase n=1 Tax=Corynebacterium sp. HS2168-gen11 TaxID=2974027 RepID=UPI00216B0E6F|nr:DEAD/DEAH box helicase [Corynebacterium sp. HS2168-gen11]MCS4535075.1 DEAD/DEAH box helicase [Corynebacterium sp. HS2168-gen11]
MNADSLLTEFCENLDFPLDDFQIQGCRAVEQRQGVLVCAPTGAGKTIVGEFAVAVALARGTKCFYTTPIKALSNQKYHDLCAAHGEENIGLLTGDVSINRDADILVMTTEVLRNMIYAQSSTLDRLDYVVMDEIHFLSDKSRGAVWEEAILGLSDSVTIVGLSATVSNSEEFGQWLNTVRGETKVIVSEHRPIPLQQWMLVGRKLFPLFEPGDHSGMVNRRLEATIERIDGDELQRGRQDFAQGRGFRARSSHRNESHRSGQPRAQDRHRALSRPDVLEILRDHDMLPAITFIFSRVGCDSALVQCMRSRLVLTTQAEADRIAAIVDAGVEDIPREDLKILGFRQWKAALMRGFAAHHAGMLPAFRHIVEDLFSQGLVRAVFATETLALGINMPARTVILEKLVKYDGEGHVDLTPGQYTQLTGRAGRRGIDILGNAVVQWAPAMDPQRVAGLASTRTYPLHSTFAPGYNMSVNLLKTIQFDAAHRLLEKSFAQYQADGSVVNEVRELERAEAHAEAIYQQLLTLLQAPEIPSTNSVEEFLSYLALRRELTVAERRAKRFAIEQRQQEITTVLSKLCIGDVIAMPGKKRPILAVVVQPAQRRHDPHPYIIMESGWAGRVDPDAFALAPIVVGTMRIPRGVLNNPRRGGKIIQQSFASLDFPRPRKMRATARMRPNAEITQLRSRLRAHPAHYWPQTDELARIGEQLMRARASVEKLRNTVSSATDTLGKTFDRILQLLSEMDYVEFDAENIPHITEEGERLASIHSECDLLVAQCLRRGIWDNLDPAELAGVVSMCTFENRRETKGSPDGATDAMADAMNHTIRIWDQLSTDERRHNLPLTKYPEAGFALAMHQWAAGAPLGYCLAAAAESGAELSPGDFVRQVLQVIDLLEQVRKSAYNDETARAARQAIDAIRRGVVAIGT